MKPSLTIASRNYGSWSLRGWLLCRLAGLDFDETLMQSDDPDTRAELLLIAPSFRVPCLRVDGAEILVHEAAWARAMGRPVDQLAPMAKLFADQTFRDVTAMAQQIFGGVGFTLEYDVQLYFRRAKQLQITWYDSRTLEEMVAAAVLD